jgi:tRNA dimethylallyltransferase
MDELGLEYRYLALHLQGKLSKEQMIEQLYTAIRNYAKRQVRYLKRNKEIRWVKNESEVITLVKRFLVEN